MSVERLADVAIPHDLQTDFGFKPEEDRIAVSRLLNLAEDQPWGVFLVEFKTKRPYLSHLRRLLRALGSQLTFALAGFHRRLDAIIVPTRVGVNL